MDLSLLESYSLKAVTLPYSLLYFQEVEKTS